MHKNETIVFDLDGTVFNKKCGWLQNIVDDLHLVIGSKLFWIFLFLYEVIEFFAVIFFSVKFKPYRDAQKIITQKIRLIQMRGAAPLVSDFGLLIMTNRSYLGLWSLYLAGFSFGAFDAIQVRQSVLNCLVQPKRFGLNQNKVFQCDDLKPSRQVIRSIKEIIPQNSKIILVEDNLLMCNIAQQQGIRVATMEAVAKHICDPSGSR